MGYLIYTPIHVVLPSVRALDVVLEQLTYFSSVATSLLVFPDASLDPHNLRFEHLDDSSRVLAVSEGLDRCRCIVPDFLVFSDFFDQTWETLLPVMMIGLFASLW